MPQITIDGVPYVPVCDSMARIGRRTKKQETCMWSCRTVARNDSDC